MRRKGLKRGKTTKLSYSTLNMFSDSELVLYIRKGNPEGYQVLVDRYDKLVRAIVARYLKRDSMAVEDACQETFLKALARIGDLRQPSRFKSWLCAIAHNQALDTIRKRKQVVSWDIAGGGLTVTGVHGKGSRSTSSGRAGFDDNTPMWQIPDTQANPAEAHSRSEVAGVVRSILQEMPELYREPISLRYEADLDYQEIADMLGKPLGTIKSLIHRGKIIIRDELTSRAGGAEGALILASS
jgi:RNA polymerase sigma-70 factor (ECF subfamily)